MYVNLGVGQGSHYIPIKDLNLHRHVIVFMWDESLEIFDRKGDTMD